MGSRKRTRPKQSDFGRYLTLTSLYGCAFVACLTWTLFPSIEPFKAYSQLGDLRKVLKKSSNYSELETKRWVQNHFRKHGAHIEFDDIFVAPSQRSNQQTAEYFLTKTCGDGRIYLFVAFPYRLPLRGEKVFEWCLIL